jgi:hypothetical protein
MPCSMHLDIQAWRHFGILWRANLETCCPLKQKLRWFASFSLALLQVLAIPAIPLTMSAGLLFGQVTGTVIVSAAGTVSPALVCGSLELAVCDPSGKVIVSGLYLQGWTGFSGLYLQGWTGFSGGGAMAFIRMVRIMQAMTGACDRKMLPLCFLQGGSEGLQHSVSKATEALLVIVISTLFSFLRFLLLAGLRPWMRLLTNGNLGFLMEGFCIDP